MKKTLGALLALILAVAMIVPTSMASSGNQTTNTTAVDDLQALYNDEKMALENYEKAIGLFDEQKPFSRIAKSEERHLQLVKNLADKLDKSLEDTKITVEEFESYQAAIDKGIEIEKEDIALLERLLAQENLDKESEDTYRKLLNGSKRHLEAFERIKENSYKLPEDCENGERAFKNKSENGNKDGTGNGNKNGNKNGNGNLGQKMMNNGECPNFDGQEKGKKDGFMNMNKQGNGSREGFVKRGGQGNGSKEGLGFGNKKERTNKQVNCDGVGLQDGQGLQKGRQNSKGNK